MSKIAILLSSYNGDAFVEDQVRTIFEQDYKDFTLYIRDDGSKPEFVAYLRELQKKYPFVLYEGENVGFLKSFMWLLREVDDAEYYAFADQDDEWYSDKLTTALTWMEKQRADLPVLFHGAYDVVTPDGEHISDFYYTEDGYDFRRSIMENHYSGFAMMINQTMREYMLRGADDRIGYHDWWAAMIAHAFGIAYSDTKKCAAHKSHGNNVTKITFGTKIKWFKKTLVEESEPHNRSMEFYKCFYNELNENDKKVIKWFAHENYHLGHALTKAFYPKRWRPDMVSELVNRCLMLIGKI